MKYFTTLCLILTALWTTTVSAADLTLTASGVTGNSVSVSIKNNGPVGVNPDGTYKSTLTGRLYAINTTSGREENSVDIGVVVGGASKSVTIINLNPNTAYSVEFQEGGGFYNATQVIKKITMRTAQGTVICRAPKILVNGVCVDPPPAQQQTQPTQTPPVNTPAITPTTPVQSASTSPDQCNDGIDNQVGDGKNYGYGIGAGDRKADRYGVVGMEPDPSCFATSVKVEKGDDLAYNSDGTPASVIPCTDKCTFGDVFRLLNNIISFFFKVILIPLFIIILIYAGVKYITAEGNPAKIANLRKILWNITKGIILMLCSWLIVRTIMTTLLNEEFKQSGVEFLGE